MNIAKDFFNIDQSQQIPVIDNKSQMILSYLKMFGKNHRDKNWISLEDMIDNFIDEMKSLYYPVYAFHEQKFDELWNISYGPYMDSIYTFREHWIKNDKIFPKTDLRRYRILSVKPTLVWQPWS